MLSNLSQPEETESNIKKEEWNMFVSRLFFYTNIILYESLYTSLYIIYVVCNLNR